MRATPPPPLRVPVPCQRDPERWFDRHDRRAALAGCLACPIRVWCAREALACNACWGMWAGVWIDEVHDHAAPYLRAIAEDEGAQPDRSPVRVAGEMPTPPPPLIPLGRLITAPPVRSVAAAVLARSSGHCEVLADGCRLGFDRTLSRRAGGARTESPSPAELFAACEHCAQAVADLQPQLATRRGYLLSPGCDPAAAPFHWRGSRWVLFRRDGWLTEIADEAQTA